MTGLNASMIVSKDTRGKDTFFTRLFRLEGNSKSESETEQVRVNGNWKNWTGRKKWLTKRVAIKLTEMQL